MAQFTPAPNPIQPDQVSGLYAWYDASNPASLNVANGAVVPTWNDLSGNNLHLIATGTTANVTYVSNAINGKGCINFTNGGTLKVSSFFVSPVHQNRTMFAVWKVLTDGIGLIWDGTANFWVNLSTTSPQGYSVNNGGSFRTLEKSRTDDWNSFVWSSDVTSSTYTVGMGHRFLDFGPGRTTNGGTATTAGGYLQIPRNGSMRIAELIFFNRRLTWTETMRVQDYISGKYNTWNGLNADCVTVSLGNSTTNLGWPYYLGLQLEDIGLPAINLGYSSGTIDTMNNQEAEIDELVDQLRRRGKKVVVTLFHGHNNMDTAAGGQSVVDHIKGPLFSGIRATGAKIFCMTTTPWHNNATKEAGRTVINNFLRSADALNYVDVVNDIGATPEFGIYGDGVTTGSKANYPTLWNDDVHFTDAGLQEIGSIIQQGVRDTIDITPGIIVPGSIATASNIAGSVQLNAAAPSAGFTPFTYQWRRDGANLSGKTSLALTDTTAQAGQSYTYDLVVTDAGGYSITSDGSSVTVISGVTITVTTLPTHTKGRSGRIVISATGTITTPITVTVSSSDPNATFSSTAVLTADRPTVEISHYGSDVGSHTLTFTNDQGMENPAPIKITVVSDDPKEGLHPIMKFRVNFMRNISTGTPVDELIAQANTRSVFIPGVGSMKHNDEFTLYGSAAYYVSQTYTGKDESVVDLLSVS